VVAACVSCGEPSSPRTDVPATVLVNAGSVELGRAAAAVTSVTRTAELWPRAKSCLARRWPGLAGSG